MWELVKSGGWMMLPIILSSIAALGIVAERLWTLRASRVTPEHLLGQVWVWIKDKQLNKDKLKELRASSPLGEVLAAGLANSKHGREIMKECIEEAAARVIHELERYINTLGTIAAMSPLLGLLGTVLGMIDIFSAFTGSGMTTNAAVLAGDLQGFDHHRCWPDGRYPFGVLPQVPATPRRRVGGGHGAGSHQAGRGGAGGP